uniref:Immunoglobulin domain-containing protein n=1 Tax=Oncorhynchus kisutch TaxID=8019 RepID=A0A8C7JNK6_ONCKI
YQGRAGYDCCEKSVTETAFLGGEATIRCNYPEDHEDDIKYFCKESNDFKTCVYMVAAHQTSAEAGRFSLSDNRTERFSTVTISDLTEDDTGTYWCGVETSRTEQRYSTLITQVKLSPATPSSPTSSSTPGTSTYPVPSSISPSSSTSSSSIPMAFVMIMVSVSLAVLVLTVILFTVYRWKCNKVQGMFQTHRQANTHTQAHIHRT